MKKETYILKWKVSKHRRDKQSGSLSPVHESQYMNSLMEGAWFKNEQKAN
ncbi:hypothetical protein GLW03_04635 [Halobacillus halophilus]|nr:hypothetical protein [Halobacillus halophilus]MYL29097.1 hypothetical protein [Halobacillus halophilus]